MIITVYMMDEVKNDYHCIHDGWSKESLSLYTWWMKWSKE